MKFLPDFLGTVSNIKKSIFKQEVAIPDVCLKSILKDKRKGREGPISLSISRKLTTRKDHGFFCCHKARVQSVQQYIQVAFLQ